jgi:DegV family protein with EDD domain
LVLSATRAAQSGKTLEDVVATVEDLKQRAHFYITLDTVEFLVRGGRASRVTGVLAGLLKIRPLLTMRDGELVLVDRPRGRATAKRRLIELAMAHLPAESIAVAHIACEEEARALASEIARQTGLPEEAIMIAETGMGLATHAGPHALAIMVASKENSMT